MRSELDAEFRSLLTLSDTRSGSVTLTLPQPAF
jgi:hypothetical protein